MVSQRRDADAPKSILESLAGTRVLVVEARYYDDIADELLAGARAAIEAVGAEARIFTVPGALEIPTAIAILMEAGRKAGGPTTRRWHSAASSAARPATTTSSRARAPAP